LSYFKDFRGKPLLLGSRLLCLAQEWGIVLESVIY